MPFQVSPGVNVTEIDLTTVVPAVSTTEGAIGGVFKWGPVGQRILVSSETELISRFGKPTNFNAETFFTAANFLSYGNKLYVSRGANTTSSNNTLLTIANANTEGQINSTTFPVSSTIFQRDSSGANIAVGVVVSVNSTTVTVNVESMQGQFTTFTGSNTSLQLISDSSGNTATISLVTEDVIVTRTAVVSSGLAADINSFIIKNSDDYTTKDENGDFAADTDTLYAAKYPGDLGNSLKISVCDSNSAFESTITANGGVSISVGDATLRFGITGANTVSNTAIDNLIASLTVGDVITLGNTSIGKQTSNIISVGERAVNATHSYVDVELEDLYALSTNFSATSVTRNWEYYNSVDKTIGTSPYTTAYGNSAASDEIHVVVADDDGLITGVPGTILEVFESLSRATDAKTEDGATLYYKDVINQNSQYVWLTNHRSNANGTSNAFSVSSSTNTKPFTGSFILGKDGPNESSVSFNVLANAYDLFASAEEVDISLILQGKARGGTHGEQLANYIIDNICEVRKDCVAFVSPDRADVVSNIGDESTDIVTFRNACRSTSYAVLDSGYKYQYDKYNDIYRYVPLNGDMAGLAVRTDETRDPWFSPAGLNRGQIKNIIKLAYNPNKANRDILYKNGINPVVTFPGQGTVLFGDKTMLSKPSAFDRINVRRLFIVLEKAIATAAKFTLFEYNDDFTRAQFKNLVEPFLRDVQGRRGIFDFKVVCDETNNTGEVIDRNEFIGDIYIKPARSINFIQLNFVAVRTGVEFAEVVGQFG
jgi:hypothetical protein